MTKRRIIEIPSDGVVCVPIMYGEETVGERRVDLSHYPVIDAVEVVHGRWIKAECSEKNGKSNCSNCDHWDWNDCNYCPNCGAKMDLE